MNARLVVGDVKKHFTSVHIPVDWKYNVHAHDFSILHRDVNGIIFKNLHFDTHFQNEHFQNNKMPFLCKLIAKI